MLKYFETEKLAEKLSNDVLGAFTVYHPTFALPSDSSKPNDR